MRQSKESKFTELKEIFWPINKFPESKWSPWSHKEVDYTKELPKPNKELHEASK